MSYDQGWGQLHNINSNSNSNSRGFNSNSNSNSGQSPEYQLQLQLRRFQLQLQFQLRQISRISTPTPTPEVSTPNSNSAKSSEYQLQLQFQVRRFQLQFQLQLCSFKSNPNSISNPINLVQLNYHYPITLQCETLYELNGGMLSIYAMLSQILIKQVNIGIADDKSSHGFLNTLLSEQNGPQFAENIFKNLFWIKMFVFSIKFHWSLIIGILLAKSQHWYS